MLWLILILISITSYSGATILQRVFMKDGESDPVAFSVVFQLMTGIFIGIYAVLHGFSRPLSFLPYIPNILIMIILYASGNIFLFNSLQRIEASEFTILFASSAFWTIFGALLFLGESFTLIQTFGTALIVLSVIIIFAKKKKFIMTKGHVFALLTALVFGLAFVNDAYLLNHFEVNSYVAFAFITPALGIWLLNPKKTKKISEYAFGKAMNKLFIVAFLQALAAIAIYNAYAIGKNAAVTGSLYKLSTIMTVILGILFLHERDHLWKKILGVVLACIGAILLVV